MIKPEKQMFGKGITLFRILGFAVRVDLSWLILALLVTWTLAVGLFPNARLGLEPAVYWAMGAAGALGMFLSILFHEFCHSLVARRYGMPMKGITLFIFGGVAEMDDEPTGPGPEFYMAIAGPLSSIVLGFVFYAVLLALGSGVPAVTGVLGYLAFINWVLAAFNLIPAFPLDGGRVLRAALWHWKKDLRRATRISSRLGSAFGIVIIFLGVVNILMGNVIGGLWQFMIGMFLRSAAQMSYQQVLVRKSLEGASVARFMSTDPVTTPSSISISQLVEQYLYRYHFKLLPVREDGRLLGCISSERVKKVPREAWDRTTVAEVMERCTVDNSVSPDTEAMKAFSLMGRTGNSRLMVIDGERLIGIITLRDIMGYLKTRMELEDGAAKAG